MGLWWTEGGLWGDIFLGALRSRARRRGSASSAGMQAQGGWPRDAWERAQGMHLLP